jgi:hypothetical protein
MAEVPVQILAEVKVLQEALNQAAAAQPALVINGIFGNRTEAAVRHFQGQHGLVADGVVGRRTWTELERVTPNFWEQVLARVPEFLKRTEISYLELIELVKTCFINPHHTVLEALQKLGISYAQVVNLDRRRFPDEPGDTIKEALKQAKVSYQSFKAWIRPALPQLNHTIVLYAPAEAACDLDKTRIQYINGGQINHDGQTWHKLNRFIRLWRKLGWSIADLDRALMAFPHSEAPDITPDFLQWLAQVQRLQTALNVPLVKLLSLWADLDTHGSESLYAKLFLNKAAREIDPAFQYRFDGALLSENDHFLSDHASTLIGAFRISTTDLDLIRADAGLTDPEDPALPRILLTLSHVSLIYRYTVLAKALSLRIIDLITLKTLWESVCLEQYDLELISLDSADALPNAGKNLVIMAKIGDFYHARIFDIAGNMVVDKGHNDFVPDATLVQELNDALNSPPIDHRTESELIRKITSSLGYTLFFENPATTEAFVEFVQKVQNSGFALAQLQYLYQPESDAATRLAPQQEGLRLLAKTLREGLTQIVADAEQGPDPQGEMSRAKLAIVFEPAIADQAVQMILDTAAVRTSELLSLPAEINFLNAGLPDNLKKRITYNQASNKLQIIGLITATERDTLSALSNNAEYQAAISDLFAQSEQFVQQSSVFIQETLVEFLDDTDEAIAKLITTSSVDNQEGKPEASAIADTNKIAAKFAYLLNQLSTYLSHNLVKQTLGDALGLESATVDALLETHLKSSQDNTQPAIVDGLNLRTPGLTGEYFRNNDLTDLIGLPQVNPSLAFNSASAWLPPETHSIRWQGMMICPNNGDFKFYLKTNWTDGKATLKINDEPLLDAAAFSQPELSSAVMALKAGQLYTLTLELTELSPPDKSELELGWSSPTIPKAAIPSEALYPANLLERFVETYSLLQKIALLVNGFKLTPKEVNSYATHSLLPLTVADFTMDRFSHWVTLNDLSTLRNNWPRGEVDLVDVLTTRATEQLVQASGWDEIALKALVRNTEFDLSPISLTELSDRLLRLQACLKLSRLTQSFVR